MNLTVKGKLLNFTVIHNISLLLMNEFSSDLDKTRPSRDHSKFDLDHCTTFIVKVKLLMSTEIENWLCLNRQNWLIFWLSNTQWLMTKPTFWFPPYLNLTLMWPLPSGSNYWIWLKLLQLYFVCLISSIGKASGL